jgi:hypothetical protein
MFDGSCGMPWLEFLGAPVTSPRPRPVCGCDGDPGAVKDVENVWEGVSCEELIQVVCQRQLNVKSGVKNRLTGGLRWFIRGRGCCGGCGGGSGGSGGGGVGIGGCGLRRRWISHVGVFFCWRTQNQPSFDDANERRSRKLHR